MKKTVSLFLACVILVSILLTAVGCSGKNTYKFIMGSSEDYNNRVTAKFSGGKLVVKADTSGLNANGVDNLAVILSNSAMEPGKYKYTEKNGTYTVEESMSSVFDGTVVFRSYYDGKYLVSSEFTSNSISTKKTEGLADFEVDLSVIFKETITFTKDGKYTLESEGLLIGTDETETGTYTFEDGLITLYQGKKASRLILVTGDGKCYTEFLMRK